MNPNITLHQLDNLNSIGWEKFSFEIDSETGEFRCRRGDGALHKGNIDDESLASIVELVDSINWNLAYKKSIECGGDLYDAVLPNNYERDHQAKALFKLTFGGNIFGISITYCTPFEFDATVDEIQPLHKIMFNLFSRLIYDVKRK